MSIQKICYVIMPFSPTKRIKNWDSVYQNLFKPVIEESKFGYKCERSEIRNGAFTKDIVQNLKTAYLVLADITDLNPNVMWELGVRHTLSQRTIMVAREDAIDEIPSDVRGYGVIAYPSDITGFKKFKEELTKVLEKIEKEPNRGDNPVFDFLKAEDLILTSIERKQIIGKLTGLLSELFDNLQYAEGFISHPQEAGKPERLHRFYTSAINELLSSTYIPIDNRLQINLRLVKRLLDHHNKLSDQLLFGKDYDDQVIEQIKKDYIVLKKGIVITVPILKQALDSIKAGRLEFVESPIFIFNQDHKKLLETK